MLTQLEGYKTRLTSHCKNIDMASPGTTLPCSAKALEMSSTSLQCYRDRKSRFWNLGLINNQYLYSNNYISSLPYIRVLRCGAQNSKGLIWAGAKRNDRVLQAFALIMSFSRSKAFSGSQQSLHQMQAPWNEICVSVASSSTP